MLNPILSVIVGKIVEKAMTSKKTLGSAAVAKEVVKEMAADPVVINETNSEAWYASRITWAAVAGVLSGIGTLVGLAASGSNDWPAYMTALTGTIASAGVLRARWGKPKAPLFSA